MTVQNFANMVYNETPGGVMNATNVTFTLASSPVGLQLFHNGLVLVNGVGYTLAGNVITMTVAPASTDTLVAFYVID